VDHELTGFLFETEGEAVAAVDEAKRFDRARCRALFEKRFSAARMARDYSNVYRSVIEDSGWRRASRNMAAALSVAPIINH
jgi:hypothetical protein